MKKYRYKLVIAKKTKQRQLWRLPRKKWRRTWKRGIRLPIEKMPFFRRFAKLFIRSKRRNTFFTLIGNRRVICKASTGLANFRGTKRKTPIAARETARFISKKFPRKFYKFIFIYLTTRAGVKMRHALRGLISNKPLPLMVVYRKKRPHSKGLRGRKKRRL